MIEILIWFFILSWIGLRPHTLWVHILIDEIFLKLFGAASHRIGFPWLSSRRRSGQSARSFIRLGSDYLFFEVLRSTFYFSKELGFYNTDTVIEVLEEKVVDPTPMHNPSGCVHPMDGCILLMFNRSRIYSINPFLKSQLEGCLRKYQYRSLKHGPLVIGGESVSTGVTMGAPIGCKMHLVVSMV